MKKMIEEEEEGEGEEREEEEGEGEGEEEEEENKLQSRDLMSGWSAEEDCRLDFRVKRRWSFPLIRQHGRFRPYPQLAPCAVHIQVSKVLLHVGIELILLVNSSQTKITQNMWTPEKGNLRAKCGSWAEKLPTTAQ